MPLMEQVREVGAEEAQITQKEIGAARMALSREIARGQRPARRRTVRRRWAGIGIGGLVGAAAATALIIGNVVGPVDAPSASAAVFDEASQGAAESADLAVNAGQYLRYEVTWTSVQRWDADSPEGYERFVSSDLSRTDAAIVLTDTQSTYVPADINGTWYTDRNPLHITGVYGERTEEATADWEESFGGGPGDSIAGIREYPAGIATATGGDGKSFEYYLDGRDEYADMPTDPEGAVQWFTERYAGENNPDGMAHFFMETIADVSAFNLAPGPVRSAILAAFATLDGVTVIEQNDDTTQLQYLSIDGDAAPVDIVLDTARGYVLSAVTPTPEEDVVPDTLGDVPSWFSRTDVSVTVVDSAPQAAS